MPSASKKSIKSCIYLESVLSAYSFSVETQCQHIMRSISLYHHRDLPIWLRMMLPLCVIWLGTKYLSTSFNHSSQWPLYSSLSLRAGLFMFINQLGRPPQSLTVSRYQLTKTRCIPSILVFTYHFSVNVRASSRNNVETDFLCSIQSSLNIPHTSKVIDSLLWRVVAPVEIIRNAIESKSLELL